jgi:hypothetical protein
MCVGLSTYIRQSDLHWMDFYEISHLGFLLKFLDIMILFKLGPKQQTL